MCAIYINARMNGLVESNRLESGSPTVSPRNGEDPCRSLTIANDNDRDRGFRATTALSPQDRSAQYLVHDIPKHEREIQNPHVRMGPASSAVDEEANAGTLLVQTRGTRVRRVRRVTED